MDRRKMGKGKEEKHSFLYAVDYAFSGALPYADAAYACTGGALWMAVCPKYL